MRKKWVIIAFVALLFIIWGVIVFMNRNRYSSKAVLTELCKNCTYVDQISEFSGMSRIERLKSIGNHKQASPSVMEKVTSWYRYHYSDYRFNQMKTVDPYKPILLFSENESVKVNLKFKMGLVDSVEITDFGGPSQTASKIKSRLSDIFPGLSCKITSSEKPDTSE